MGSDSDSVVKQINRINNSVNNNRRGKTGGGPIRTSQVRQKSKGYGKNPGPSKTVVRPQELSRIAISGTRNYRKSNSRRKSASGRRRKSWISPIALIMAGVIAVAAVGGGVGYAIWYNSFTEVTLADYTTVALSGFNHYGQAELSFNGDAEYTDFFKTVTASLDKTSNLGNGDELLVSFAYDEAVAKENKLRINASSEAIVVGGLEEATIINKDVLFSAMDLQLTGISPCIKPEVTNTTENEKDFLYNVTYVIQDEGAIYSSGDEIVIEAQVDTSQINIERGFLLDLSDEDYQTTVIVPDGDAYFTDSTQVTDSMLAELEQEGFKLISKADAKEYGLRIFQQEAHLQPVFVGNTTTFKWANPYVISAYFHSVTESGKLVPESHANDVQIVYGATLTQQDGQSCQAEMVVQFVNLKTLADGSIDLNLSSGRIVSASYRNSNIKNLVSGGDDGVYHTTKLTE